MRRFLSSLCVAFVLLFVYAMIPFEGECRSIADNVLRVHILANSDSEEDQTLKLKVRDALLRESENMFSDVHSKEEAMLLAADNLDHFAKIAYKTLKEYGYDYTVSAQIANVCFDTRNYDDISMPSGYYDALQIKIGKAQGKNWWCVMYPSLCIGAASDLDDLENKLTDDQYNIVNSHHRYVFKFKVVEIFNSFVDWFNR